MQSKEQKRYGHLLNKAFANLWQAKQLQPDMAWLLQALGRRLETDFTKCLSCGHANPGYSDMMFFLALLCRFITTQKLYIGLKYEELDGQVINWNSAFLSGTTPGKFESGHGALCTSIEASNSN